MRAGCMQNATVKMPVSVWGLQRAGGGESTRKPSITHHARTCPSRAARPHARAHTHLQADDDGALFCWGAGDEGQLGHGTGGTRAHRLVPMRVAGPEVFGAPLRMVAAGRLHAAAVTDTGALFTWGRGAEGQLGHGYCQRQLAPRRVPRELMGGLPVVLAACGDEHTLAVTADGNGWSWGNGDKAQLGHGDLATRLQPTPLGPERFGSAAVAVAACGAFHNIALTQDGRVWTWGRGGFGALGHGNQEAQLTPTLVEPALLGGERAVSASAGFAHSMCVVASGALFAWGANFSDQLGMGVCQITLLACACVRTCVLPCTQGICV